MQTKKVASALFAGVMLFADTSTVSVAQSTSTVVVSPKIRHVCYSLPDDDMEVNDFLWEERVGRVIPLDRQERAKVMMGEQVSIMPITSGQRTELGARSGDNYLVAICLAGRPPVHSLDVFREWTEEKAVAWNIDGKHRRLLTNAGDIVGPGGGDVTRTIVYYSLPSKVALDTHEHALLLAR